MSSRRRRPRSPVTNRDGASASDSPAPLTARTLRLFTVSDDAPAAELTERKPAGNSSVAATSKNPRWVLQREKELRSEAIRERMLHLVSQIELEEARNRPAKRKAWLHEKKMELRRLTFKQPDDIIAGENYMKRARRKLREARRRRREKDGGRSNDEEGEEEEDDDDESDDSRDRSSSSERKDGKDKKKANKDSKKRQGDRPSERSRRSAINGASGGPRSSGDEADDADGDSDDESTNGGVFNLNPTGRLSRPNPRSPVPEQQAEPEQLTKKEMHLQKMAKVVRFPLESGYKLGRKIRKHRDKRKASSAHGGSTRGGDSDSQNGECKWGERVDYGQNRLQRRRRSSTSEAETFNRRRDDGVRVIVTNDSDRDDTDDSRSGGGGAAGDADNIPELQESVGKKIRDRLAIRRPRWRSRNSASSEGSEAEQDAKSGGDDDKSDKAKQKKKKEKEKDKKEKEKKEKDKLEAKKTKKEQQADEGKNVDAEATEKQKKTKKKDKKTEEIERKRQL